mmetsp:Transcript_88660/g.271437  ORF Transcript_88660/g.271437 Transcript_88660/m.271437 type:complete len:489 (-) Transcript_88660:188-1654(-)
MRCRLSSLIRNFPVADCRAAASAPRLGALAAAHEPAASARVPLSARPPQPLGAPTAVASVHASGRSVDVYFEDGAAFRFHAIWLRDACRDAAHVSQAAGERLLPASAVVAGCRFDLRASAAKLDAEGKVRVEWDDALSRDSIFDPAFLRTYAGAIAKPLEGQSTAAEVDVEWLRPYSGYPGVRAPRAEDQRLWAGSGDDFERFDFGSLADPAANLEMMRALLRDGAIVVQDMPDVADASALIRFTDEHAGSLQKDPARDEANWKITKRENAQSISYNADLRLNNHTDQSIPSHGAVGLLLAVHYVDGRGFNTLADGFACGEALRQRNPQAFKLLSTHCVDAERDYIASRMDADQNHTNSLLISTKYPVLQTDDAGQLWRVQYNEVFRTPSTLPYDVFPEWYEAFREYVDILHSAEFERTVEMKKGELLLLQNWRVLHGRAGVQSPSRTLMGGTITRENFYSKACQMIQRTHGVEPYRVHVEHRVLHRG